MSISKILKSRYIKVLIAFIAFILLLGTSMAWADPVDGYNTGNVYDLSIPEGEDEGIYYAYAVIDGVLWEIHRSESSTGTGTFDPFIRFDAGQDGIEVAYNTDGTIQFTTKSSPHTHSITLAEVPIATREIEGHTYTGREFYIDINQKASGDDDPLLVIDDYQFWMTSDPELTGYDLFGTDTGYDSLWHPDNPEPVWLGEIDWNFHAPMPVYGGEDPDDPVPPEEEGPIDRQIIMDYNVENGSGWGDYRVIIPNEYFMEGLERYNAREGYDDLTPSTAYLVLFVRHSNGNDGFEEWAIREIDTFPSVSITKNGDTLSKIGDEVTYTYKVENTGNVPIDLVSIEDDIVGTIDTFGNAGRFDDVLDVGEIEEIQVVWEIPATINGEPTPDPLVNTVTANYAYNEIPVRDLDGYVPTDTHSIDLFAPAIDVVKTGDEFSKVGDEVTYTITVYNNSSTDTPDMYFDITDTMLGIDLDDVVIANGDTHVITETFTIPADAADPFVNTVNVYADFKNGEAEAAFPNTYTDSDTHSIDLFQPSISITKEAEETEVKVGDKINYTVVVYNDSSFDTPTMEFDVNDDKYGFLGTVSLDSGESHTFNYEIEVTDDMWMNDNPFVNTVNTTASPIGFPNIYRAEASWTVKIYKEETAWALWDPENEDWNTNLSIIKTNNWGWHLGPLDTTTSSSIEYELWAAAGQNMTANGYLVGSVEVVIDAIEKTVTVYYNVDPDYDMMEYHLWIGETPLPVIAKGKKFEMTDAPGQMTFEPGVAYYIEELQEFEGFEDYEGIYVAAHAVIRIYEPMD